MLFIWEALAILIVSFILIRIAGRKTVTEMSGLEVITLLAMASLIGHAVLEQQWWKTVVVLCIFVSLLIIVQFLSLKFDFVERWMMGKATLVIKEGKIVTGNLKKIRMSVDQLEAKLREKGISSIADVKLGTIEMNGGLGYELMRHAKPLTIGELEKIFKLPKDQSKREKKENIFDETLEKGHKKEISPKLD
jgi:uncharacterized membrane protein YcaP (DUF421 family)